MHAKQFLECLQHPQQLTSEQVVMLREVAKLYPYCQAVHALLAKVAYAKNPQTASTEVQKAAVYAVERNYLRALLEEAPPFAPPPPLHTMPSAAPQAAPQEKENAVEEHFINGHISRLRQQQAQKITKQKVLAQLDLIQAFIDSNTAFKPQLAQAPLSAESQADLTKESTCLHDDLLTENLAKILFQQGKVKQAIDIYDKLSLKYPQKRTYFAALSQELNTQA